MTTVDFCVEERAVQLPEMGSFAACPVGVWVWVWVWEADWQFVVKGLPKVAV